MRKLALQGFFMLLICSVSQAHILNVPNQNFPTIKLGIDSAMTGDTVLVGQGTYDENLTFRGRDIVLGSNFIIAHDDYYIYSTVIDGGARNTVIIISMGEGEATMIEGFTIQNGLSSSRAGGISISGEGTRPKICNNRIVSNISASSNGGGISCFANANPTICHNYIAFNRANSGNGGGISCVQCTANIYNNLIINNLAKL